MKTYVRSKLAEVGAGVRAHIAHRIEFGLGKFRPHIVHVTVQIVDLNGPRGGLDKVCRIEIRLLPTGSIFVEDADTDIYAAVDLAVGRAARAVSRAIGRRRHFEHDATWPRSNGRAGPHADTAERSAVGG
jgi:putative sigma-54 modulation protein